MKGIREKGVEDQNRTVYGGRSRPRPYTRIIIPDLNIVLFRYRNQRKPTLARWSGEPVTGGELIDIPDVIANEAKKIIDRMEALQNTLVTFLPYNKSEAQFFKIGDACRTGLFNG